jgi:hypothetical protein
MTLVHWLLWNTDSSYINVETFLQTSDNLYKKVMNDLNLDFYEIWLEIVVFH